MKLIKNRLIFSFLLLCFVSSCIKNNLSSERYVIDKKVKYKLSGELDTSFNNKGYVISPEILNKEFSEVSITGEVYEDSIYVSGCFLINESFCQIYIAKYRTDGSLDKYFSNKDGFLIQDHFKNSSAEIFSSFAITKNGDIFIPGFVYPKYKTIFQELFHKEYPRNFIAKYNVSGVLDKKFSNGGILFYKIKNNAVENSFDMAIMPDDNHLLLAGDAHVSFKEKINNSEIVVGTNEDIPLLVKFNIDGTKDHSFGTKGILFPPHVQNNGNRNLQSEDKIKSIKLQKDKKILIAGHSWPPMDHFHSDKQLCCKRFLLGRMDPNGMMDKTFGNNGYVILNNYYDKKLLFMSELPQLIQINSIAIQDDNKIIVGGYYNENHPKSALARFNENGTLDTKFGENGYVFEKNIFSEDDEEFESIVIESTGRLITAGLARNKNLEQNFFLSAYTKDGELDKTFGNNGRVFSSNEHIGSLSIRGQISIKLQENGKLLLFGINSFSNDSGHERFFITRFK